MVHILVNIGFDRTVRNLLQSCDRQLDGYLSVDSYQSTLVQRRVAPGTYVFTDFERCPRRDGGDVLALWDQLRASGLARLVNDPRRVLGRYPLLRMLSERGINDFNVYRPTDDLGALRFPVFVRCEHDHGGARTELLHTRPELEHALDHLRANRAWKSQLLITECAAAPDTDGRYRKYGALLVNGHVLPCHLLVSRDWFVKSKIRVVDDRLALEERRYVEENPHADQLRALFSLAHIEYGRIDYGFVNGRLQVYEINTNPQIVGRPGRSSHPGRQAKRRHLIRQLVDVFRAMATEVTAPPGATVVVTPHSGVLPGWAYRGVRTGQSLVTRFAQRSGIR